MARTPPLGPAGRVPGRTDHVVVVGAGLSGLSAALHLVGAGRTVTVLERDPRPGGRAGQAEMAGYRVDTGASVLTMPDLIEETFAAVGESLSERLELIPVRPAYRAVFADDSTLDVHSDAEAMAAEIRSVIGAADAAGYLRLRHWLGELYRARRDAFLDANVDSPLDLLNPKLAALVALGGFGRLGPAVGRFVRDERLRRVFTFHSLCAGVSPESALAGYGAMPGMDMVRGVFFPRGGVGALAEAMAAAARDAGARLRFDTPVAWLERVGSRVSAVRTTAGERIPCDAVVLTPDLQAAYRLLGVHPRRLWPTRWAPSAFLLHAGTTRTWPKLRHHTIFFGSAWRSTFTEVIRDGRLMTDPTLLVTNPTLTDPALAPAGRHLVRVLAPVPNLRTSAVDWPRIAPAYRDELVRVLDRRGLSGLDGAIEMERAVTPIDWANLGLAAGTPFSAARTLAQTGPFRAHNLIKGVANVVLAGCGTVPGSGVPAVLISGRLAAQRITG
ncbi:MAG TPA: phytoene desaturase family protein [Pseudonocardiaceae bacterium]